jgi:hypothetical protein
MVGKPLPLLIICLPILQCSEWTNRVVESSSLLSNCGLATEAIIHSELP